METNLEFKEKSLFSGSLWNEKEILNSDVTMKLTSCTVTCSSDHKINFGAERKEDSISDICFQKYLLTDLLDKYSNCSEMDTKIEIKEENVDQYYEMDFPSNVAFNNTVPYSDGKVEMKIEVKEEPAWKESTLTDTKCHSEVVSISYVPVVKNENEESTVDDPSTGSPRLYSERISVESIGKSALFTSADLGNRESFKVKEESTEYEKATSEVCSRNFKETSCPEIITSKQTPKSKKFDLNKHSDKSPFKCNVCHRSFTMKSHLTRHISIHEGQLPYRCEICEKRFSHLEHLKQHNLIHEDNKPYKCENCAMSFVCLPTLNRHLLEHNSQKAYKCENCEESFAELQCLKKHNVIHEGIKPYKCGLCCKSYRHSATLRRHNLMHEQIKPYKCKICDKSFIQMSSLKRHNLLHEGKKPYKCELCEKSFTQLSHLKRHNSIHNGKTPYKCEICTKSYNRIESLKIHILIHEGKRPYKCTICEKGFTQLGNLKSHNLIHEGKKPIQM